LGAADAPAAAGASLPSLSRPAFTLSLPAPRISVAPSLKVSAAPTVQRAAAAALAAPAVPQLPPAEPAFATEESVRGKTVVMVGTKGSRPFIMEEAARVAKELGLTLVLVDSI